MNRVAVLRHVGSSPMARLARMNLAAMIAAGFLVLDLPQRHSGIALADWTYCHVLPLEHMCAVDGIKVAYWNWTNATYLPDAWLDASAEYKQIWVPSPHSLRSLIKGGIDPMKVKVIPPYVHFGNTINLSAAKPSFLTVVEGRQSGWPVVEAFKHAFNPIEEVTLTIKASGLVSEDLVHFRKAAGNDNRISLVEASFNTAGMLDLFRSNAVYVTATPFNDVGINVLLAMANGLPVVSPLLSESSEFCQRSTCYPVSHTLNTVDVEHMASQMKQARRDINLPFSKEITLRAYQNAVKHFNFASTVDAIKQATSTL